MRNFFFFKNHLWSGFVKQNKFRVFPIFAQWNQRILYNTIFKLAIHPSWLSSLKQLCIIPTRNLFYRVDHLHDSILSCNWEDHLNFVHNKDFFETENEDLQKEAELLLVHKTTPSLHTKLIEIEQALTCFKQCTFVRDYIMGIIECLKHNEMNTFMEEDLQYLSDSMLKIEEAYRELLERYAFLTPKINQAVQTALALLLERVPLRKLQPNVSRNI